MIFRETFKIHHFPQHSPLLIKVIDLSNVKKAQINIGFQDYQRSMIIATNHDDGAI